MAEDIARLGMRVDSQGIKEGADGLDRLSASAARADTSMSAAEAAADALATSSREVGAAATAGARAVEGAAGANRNAAAAAAQVSAQQSKATSSYAGYAAQAAYASQQTERFANATFDSKAAYQSGLASLSQLHRTVGAYSTAVTTANPHIDRHAKSVSGAAISAKQHAAAMRLLPAQLTDIVTGLVSGQPAYLVAIQQGGQLRDSFGGLGATFKALGTILTPTRLAIGALAGAAAVAATAYAKGQAEISAFNQALILNGNAAGTSADRLQEDARAIDAIVGTTAEASRILAQLASSGRVAADELRGAAQLAVQLEKSAGVSADETVKAFVDLGKRPSEAIKALDERYRFLTVSTYKQIRALEEEGRVAEAAALAQRTFTSELTPRAEAAERSLGSLQRTGRATANVFREMWDAVLGIGRPRTIQDEIADLQRQLESGIQNVIAFDPGGGPVAQIGDVQRRQLEAELRRLRAIQNPDDFASRRARAEQNRQQAAIRDADTEREAAQRSREQAARDAEQRERTRSSAAVAAIKRTLAEESAAYDQQQDLLDARRAAGLVTERAYYEERRRLISAGAEAQQRALTEENQRLQQESSRVSAAAAAARATADSLAGLGSEKYGKALDEANRRESEAQAIQIQNAERIKENKAEIIALDRERASQIAVLGVQEAAHSAAIVKATDDARRSLERYLAVQERQRQRELEGLGAGSLQRQFNAGRNEIEDRYEQQRQEIDRDRRNNPQVDPAVFREREQQVNQALATELASYERHWAALRTGEQNWRIGASEAIRNYLDDVANTARVTQNLVSSTLQRAEDAWVKFVQTGKLSFRDLINSVIADLARLAAQKLLSSLLGSLSFAGASGSAPSFLVPSARGNVFRAPALSHYSNQIVRRPTIFPFANGIGLMGEDGDEAIMPLQRTRNGKLGVLATGGNGGLKVSIQNIGAPKTWDVRQVSPEEVRIIARDEIARGAPDAVADHLSNPNSRVSKALSRNTTAGRQRN